MSLNVAECSLGEAKLEPTLLAAVCCGHVRGFALKGFVAKAL